MQHKNNQLIIRSPRIFTSERGRLEKQTIRKRKNNKRKKRMTERKKERKKERNKERKKERKKESE
jgi:hypothetical protein